MTTTEQQIEIDRLPKLGELNYTYGLEVRDRAALEANFQAELEALNRVHLTDSAFQYPLDSIVTPDVYNAAQTLQNINSFERDEGSPLKYAFVNIQLRVVSNRKDTWYFANNNARHFNINMLFCKLFLRNLNRFATGQAQLGLSVEELEKVDYAIPNDKAERQKIDTLKTHKKGLMQRLFSVLDEVST